MTAPLTDKDLEEIKARQTGLGKVKDVLRRAEQAGIDVSVQKKEHSELESRLTGLRNAFFPGQ